MKTFARLSFIVLFVSLWMPSTAEARRPMGTTMTGTVQSIDHTTRWIVFAQEGRPLRRFVYSEWAKFWHGTSDTSPMALKPGMKVQIKLHNPLFGPDYVNQIVLRER